jgi:hypothetical protein
MIVRRELENSLVVRCDRHLVGHGDVIHRLCRERRGGREV